MWFVEWSSLAREEIRRLPTYARVRIMHAIQQWLRSAPFDDNGNRIKRIENLKIPWSENRWTWQLKVDPYRVFYDPMEMLPDERESEIEGVIVIQAVRFKPHGARTEDILYENRGYSRSEEPSE